MLTVRSPDFPQICQRWSSVEYSPNFSLNSQLIYGTVFFCYISWRKYSRFNRSNKTTCYFLYFFSFSLNAWRVRRPEVATSATIDSFNTQNGPTEYAQTYYANDLLTPFFRDPSLAVSNEIFLCIALELLIIRKYTSHITWWTMVLSGLKQTSRSRFKNSTAPLQLFSTHVKETGK